MKKDRINLMTRILISLVFTMLSGIPFAFAQTSNPTPSLTIKPSPKPSASPQPKSTPQIKISPTPQPNPKLTPLPSPKVTPQPSPTLNPQKTESKTQVSVQEDPNNQLGLIYSVKKLEAATKLFNEGSLPESEKLVLEVKDWLTDVTEYHYSIYQIFNKGLKTVSAGRIERAHALDFGQLRDKAYFLLAKIYISQNKLKDAVKLLVEIIKSEGDTDLGQEAYKTLQEIKFSDKPK